MYIHHEDEYSGHDLIFIVGCSRSGTTWLQRLLACHPKIHTGQETHLFSGYIGPLLGIFNGHLNPQLRGSGIGLGCYFTEEEFHTVLRSFINDLICPIRASLNPDEFFVEKTPDHAFYLPEIIRFFPRCKIIHMLRDARDVVASLLAASKSWGTSWAPKNAREAAIVWTKFIHAVRMTEAQIPQQQLFEVRYEELCKQPHMILTDCAEFLGLTWNESDISSAVETNNPKHPSFSGSGTPIPIGGEAKRRHGLNAVNEPQGFIRNANPGGWRQDLTLIEKYQVWRICRKIMAREGYIWPFFLSL